MQSIAGNLAVKAVVGLSSVGLLLFQSLPTLPVVSGPDPLSSFGRLSLDGCLIVAVGVLWKAQVALLKQKDEMLLALQTQKDVALDKKDMALKEKDAQLMALVDRMSAAMAGMAEGRREIRDDFTGLRELLTDLSERLPARESVEHARGTGSVKLP